MSGKAAFFETLKTEFVPRLRESGFRGSGQNFRRVRGEIINTINLQGTRYGGQCALNIGLHLTFLPTSLEQLPDVRTVKEINCEFRSRVAPDNQADFWWDYGNSEETAWRNARHLINTYFAAGEARFRRYETIESIVGMYLIEFLDSPACSFHSDISFGHLPGTKARVALAMARIHEHLGNFQLAKEFAASGLANVGRGVSLIPHFQKIIDSSS